MKKKKSSTFLEEYIVRYDRQKMDGYWENNQYMDISVPCQHGVREKNNHEKAEKEFFRVCQVSNSFLIRGVQYKQIRIVSTTYC